MEIIKSFTMTVLSTIIFSMFCEFLLPSGSIKKYIRFSIGALLVLIILNFFRNNSKNMSLEKTTIYESPKIKNSLNFPKIHELQTHFNEICDEKLKLKLEETLKKELNCEILSVNIKFDTEQKLSISGVSLKIKPSPGQKKETIANEVISLVSKKLMIEKNNITCEVE